MIVVLAILAATRAPPLDLQSPPLVSLGQLQSPSCDDPNGCRSLWDIIRSCALTIFLCTWVSIHPNIPSPDERWPRIALRRVGLMLAALIVPEAIIAWAMRQRVLAVELARIHKGEGWTITHGFFATMGGFMAYEGNRPVRVLLPDQLRSYSLTGNGDFPGISKREIEDKSKGDVISKGVVILQTGWFVAQCIARGVQGLPITELELVTVAFAALNFAIYLLWWDKPLNVQSGVRVYRKRRTEEPIDDGDVEDTVGFWRALRDALSGIPATIIRGPFIRVSSWPWPVRVLVWPIAQPLIIMTGDDTEHERRVNTFYPSSWGAADFSGYVIVTPIASAFGGVHCIGWSFNFPSSLEQILWRVASVSITGIPIMFSLVVFATDKLKLTRTVLIGGLQTGHMILIPPLFLYILGRLALLALPLLCLRSLPPAAYHVVHWTSLIPHI